jgi:hypothetical protein
VNGTDAATGGNPGVDVIGDVHGHADRLRSLLAKMGYDDRGGAWRHPTRTAVFVGDLIDRGPHQLATLRLVRAMVDAGSARIVMGNHEFNAVSYATVDPVRLGYCRPHSGKNRRQHAAFLREVEFDSPLHRSIIEWFRTIPLWLDLDGLRVVHACWSEEHLDHLSGVLGPGRTLTNEAIIAGNTKGTATYDAIETVLKGPEVDLDGICYHDKDGNPRRHARLRWWDGTASTLATAALIPPGTRLCAPDGTEIDALPDRPLAPDEVAPYTDATPVLFGHYWWRKEAAEPVRDNAMCLDFSVAKGGVLCAYRWDGEPALDPGKFVDA